MSAPLITVASNLDTVNWQTHVVLTTDDNLAFSTHTLSTADGQFYVVPREYLQVSEFLKNIIDTHTLGDIVNIPIKEIDGRTLSVILLYIYYHHGNKAPRIDKPLTKPIREILTAWDKNYFETCLLVNNDERRHEMLINVSKTAHYLRIAGLADLSNACIADSFRDKTVEQMRELYSIENDFTPAETQEIIEANKWVNEETDK